MNVLSALFVEMALQIKDRDLLIQAWAVGIVRAYRVYSQAKVGPEAADIEGAQRLGMVSLCSAM